MEENEFKPFMTSFANTPNYMDCIVSITIEGNRLEIFIQFFLFFSSLKFINISSIFF